MLEGAREGRNPVVQRAELVGVRFPPGSGAAGFLSCLALSCRPGVRVRASASRFDDSSLKAPLADQALPVCLVVEGGEDLLKVRRQRRKGTHAALALWAQAADGQAVQRETLAPGRHGGTVLPVPDQRMTNVCHVATNLMRPLAALLAGSRRLRQKPLLYQCSGKLLPVFGYTRSSEQPPL